MKNENSAAAAQRFQPGDRIYDKRYGYGTIKKVNMEKRGFPYYVVYDDGTKIWYSAEKAVPAAQAQQ